MAFIEWRDQYLLHNHALDKQHQRIFSHLNDLHTMIIGRHGKEMIRHVIAQLTDTLLIHHAEEEKLMLSCRHPDFAEHKAQHEKLLKQLSDLDSEIEKMDGAVPSNMFAFLTKDWLVGHILKMDKKIVQ